MQPVGVDFRHADETRFPPGRDTNKTNPDTSTSDPIQEETTQIATVIYTIRRATNCLGLISGNASFMPFNVK